MFLPWGSYLMSNFPTQACVWVFGYKVWLFHPKHVCLYRVKHFKLFDLSTPSLNLIVSWAKCPLANEETRAILNGVPPKSETKDESSESDVSEEIGAQSLLEANHSFKPAWSSSFELMVLT